MRDRSPWPASSSCPLSPPWRRCSPRAACAGGPRWWSNRAGSGVVRPWPSAWPWRLRKRDPGAPRWACPRSAWWRRPVWASPWNASPWCPHPGTQWPAVTAALIDAVDMILIRPPGGSGRPTPGGWRPGPGSAGWSWSYGGAWPEGADLHLSVHAGALAGPRAGHGHLQARSVEVTAKGRGAAARERRVQLWLPGPTARSKAPGRASGRGPGRRPAAALPPRRSAGRRWAASRTLVVWCPDWPVVAAGYGASVPVAVVSANRVVACSEAARRTGSRWACGAGRRRAAAPKLVVIDQDPGREARAFEPVVAAVEAFTPSVEVGRPGMVAFGTRGPSRYFGGDRALAAKVAAAVDAILAPLGSALPLPGRGGRRPASRPSKRPPAAAGQRASGAAPRGQLPCSSCRPGERRLSRPIPCPRPRPPRPGRPAGPAGSDDPRAPGRPAGGSGAGPFRVRWRRGPPAGPGSGRTAPGRPHPSPRSGRHRRARSSGRAGGHGRVRRQGPGRRAARAPGLLGSWPAPGSPSRPRPSTASTWSGCGAMTGP